MAEPQDDAFTRFTGYKPKTAAAQAAPAEDDAFTRFTGYKSAAVKAPAQDNSSPELTAQQRDTITRWGLDPRNFTRQTAPLETPQGLRDPQTNELVVAGKPMTAPQWGPAQAFANGALQGLGTRLQAAEASLQPGAPSDAYDQATAAYEGARHAYNASHPITGTGSEVTGSIATAIPLMMGGGAAIEAGGSAAARAAPWLTRAEPVADFMAGRGGTNMLTRGASLAAAGAGAGAGNALLSYNLSDEPIGNQIATGAAVGGWLGAGVPAVVGALGGAGSAIKRAVEPFSESGRNAIADRVIAKFAGENPTIVGPATVTGANELIPGSTPTLAQATANPGIAALERGVHDASTLGNNLLEGRKAANQIPRNNALSVVRGDEVSLENLIQAREQAADPLREAAFKNVTGPANPSNVVQKIDDILQGPAGQRDAVVKSLNNIRGKLVKDTVTLPNGSTAHVLEDDPRQLYGIRQAIGDLLSPLAHNTESNAQLASKELMQIKGELDNSIEGAAPGFKGYLAKFSEMSNPVDTQKLLQKMKVYDTNGNITAGSMDRAITQIERGRAAGGANQAKSVSDSDLKTLYALRDDLRREGNSSLGKAIGSNTLQNLATNNLMAQTGLPVNVFAGLGSGHPIAAAAAYGVRHMYARQNKPVLRAMADRLLNPNPSQVNRLLNPSAPTSPLVNSLAPYMIPPAIAANRELR